MSIIHLLSRSPPEDDSTTWRLAREAVVPLPPARQKIARTPAQVMPVAYVPKNGILVLDGLQPIVIPH